MARFVLWGIEPSNVALTMGIYLLALSKFQIVGAFGVNEFVKTPPPPVGLV